MSKTIYQMAGTIQIPEEKQKEYMHCVRRIREQCFARFKGKSTEKILTGILQESMSETICCLMRDEEICPVQDYAVWLQEVLGRKIRLPWRGRLWELLLLLKQTEKFRGISDLEVWEKCPLAFTDVPQEQLLAVLCVADAPELRTEAYPAWQNIFSESRSRLADGTYAFRSACLSLVFRHMTECDDFAAPEAQAEFLHRLAVLLDADLPRRQQLAQESGAWGLLAEISAYVLPAVILKAYARVKGGEFWDLWFSMKIQGYTDIVGRADEYGVY
ncbi:MAG: hypothetical protein IJ716_09920 [Lachnospiraceae bacterium]|nr:hypothetical protein [Lachnospiraceae bacterium]